MPKKRPNVNRPLTVSIKDDQLVISIGVSTLAYAIQNGANDWTGKITNDKAFAKDVVAELLSELEDGTTPVHAMLDEAARLAAEGGSVHVALDDEESGDR